MYQLTQDDIDNYWMAVEGGMGWMRKWLGWWVVPNHHSNLELFWCENRIGPNLQDWACYDGRFYFKQQTDALMFVLKFGGQSESNSV